jgi:hypothetical protein
VQLAAAEPRSSSAGSRMRNRASQRRVLRSAMVAPHPRRVLAQVAGAGAAASLSRARPPAISSSPSRRLSTPSSTLTPGLFSSSRSKSRRRHPASVTSRLLSLRSSLQPVRLPGSLLIGATSFHISPHRRAAPRRSAVSWPDGQQLQQPATQLACSP